MYIHNSHSLQQNSYNIECHNCFGCSCHFPDILVKACDHSVEIETNNPRVVQAVERQATLYGTQMRSLKRYGGETDKLRVRQAWVAFLRQFNKSYLARVSSTAFSAALHQS